MKTHLLVVAITLLLAIKSQANSGDKKEISGDHFLVKGKVYEVDMLEGTEMAAVTAQVVVYQEKEIYVAFFTEKDGLYEFYLPIGHTYEIWFGGSAFINKKVQVDSNLMSGGKKPQKLDLDIGLFRPMDNEEFPLLNEPFVIIAYDEEMAALIPDLEYTEEKAVELEKQFRKIKKVQGKKSKDAE